MQVSIITLVLLRIVFVLLATVSVIRVTCDGFGLSINDLLEGLLSQVEGLFKPVVQLLTPAIEAVFRWVNAQFGLDLTIQPHWQYAFTLLWLFLGSYAKVSMSWADAPISTAFRLGASFFVALIFGALTGTVPLDHPNVLYYPVAGFFLFLSLNTAWEIVAQNGASTSNQSGALKALVYLIVFAHFWLLASVVPLSMIIAGSTVATLPILLLMGTIFVFGFYLVVSALRNHDGDDFVWWRDANTRMGLSIVIVIGGAITAVAVDQYSQLWTSQEQTMSEVGEDGYTRDCSVCPPMIDIREGTFVMGASGDQLFWARQNRATDSELSREQPAHVVEVRKFSMSVTEVTRDQFAAFVDSANYRPSGFCWGFDEVGKNIFSGRLSWRNPGFPQTGSHPVVCVNWYDAKAYVRWLSRKTGKKYRLPSEAEWEYAARSGSETGRYWGEGNDDACQYANVQDLVTAEQLRISRGPDFNCTDGFAFTAPVMSFTANGFGLFDMMGSVSEWVEDCFNLSYVDAPGDGSAWLSGDCSVRVLRGGAWYNDANFVRSSSRYDQDAGSRMALFGFRVVRTD